MPKQYKMNSGCGFFESRRNFLKSSLSSSVKASIIAASGTLGFAQLNSSCSSLEGAFQADRRSYDKEVIIVGGGLAGLSAAYALKRQKIPFRLFEADHKLGGRVQSKKFTSSDQVVELGAEFLKPQDKNMLEIIKEFNIETQIENLEVKSNHNVYFQNLALHRDASEAQSDSISSEKNKKALGFRLWKAQEIWLEGQSFQNLMAKLKLESEKSEAQRNEIYQRLENQLGSEFFDKITQGTGPGFREFLKSKLISDFGSKWGENSSALLFGTYLEGVDPFISKKISRIKIKNGNSELIRALHDRLKGVLPEFFVKTSMALHSISRNENKFRMRFEDHGQSKMIEARFVILALPPPVLQKLKGWKELELPTNLTTFLNKLKMNGQTKLYWGLKEDPLENSLGRLALQGDFINENIGLAYNGPYKSRAMVSIRNSDSGKEINPQDIVKDLELYDKKWLTKLNSEVFWLDWSRNAWTQGSKLIFEPRTYLERAKNFSTSLSPLYGGNLALAGDFTSEDGKSSMESAWKSGRHAANQIKEAIERNKFS